jgi:hypothetical protein
MTGLVIELQRDALNEEIKVSNLLRKALLISKKLGIVEIEYWLNNELNGYSTLCEVPEYRLYDSHFNYCGNSDLLLDWSISEVERAYSITGELDLIKVLNRVRNNILNWTSELEQQGILGEGMSFSTEEKTKAKHITYQIINNIGSMHNSQLQQDSAHANQTLNVTENNTADLKKFVDELKKSVDSFQLVETQLQKLNKHIGILENQSELAKPDSVIIKESGRTIRNIIEGATGSTISTAVVSYFHLFQ